MKRLPPLFLAARLSAALVLFGSQAIGPAAWAQAPAPPQTRDQLDFEQAAKFVEAGEFEKAAPLYEGIPKNYPTSPLIPQATLRLGYTLFRENQYDQAIRALQKVPTLKAVPAEVAELAASLIPQIASAKAASFKIGEPRRKAAFEDAVKQFDAFLQKFPKSDEVETANYGKAVAAYQVEKYQEALDALRTNLTKFSTSQQVLDSEYMMALTMETVANVAAQKAGGAPDKSADSNYDNAEKMFSDVVGKGTDVALAADARFQIGELLFARGGFVRDEKMRDVYFARALDNFRAVASKQVVIAAQKSRIDRIGALRSTAISNHDLVEERRLRRAIEKENEKLTAITARPDQTLAAKIKMGEIFFRLGRFDETRIVLNYAKPLAEDDDQKKQIAYFIGLSLAAQNNQKKGVIPALSKRAEEVFAEFKKTYPTDPIGESLALAIGSGFVDRAPQKAITYAQAFLSSYPRSKLRTAAMAQEAAAYAHLEQNEEAIKMFKETLAGNPPPEVAASAEFGIATVLHKLGQLKEAIEAFKTVLQKYRGSEQAEQAGFYLGRITLESGDPKAALVELEGFVRDHPKSNMMDQALYYLAQAQAGSGQTGLALNTYEKVSSQFPQAEVAPYCYFQRVAILMSQQKMDEVVKLMREFIQKYPESPQVYQAYNTISEVAASEQNEAEAIKVQEEFAKDKPQDTNAPQALLRVATLWKQSADKLPKFVVQTPEQKTAWTRALANSVAAGERVVKEYPNSPQVALALTGIMDCFKARLHVKQATEGEIDDYFGKLADQYQDKPATRSKIVFTHAAFMFDKDKSKAVALMAKVYDEKQKYAPEELDLYASALLEQKKYEQAGKLGEKLAADYPVPKNVTDPTKASRDIQEAQADSLFTRGIVLREQGKTDEAKKLFDELEQFYSWSPKMLEANYNIAFALHAQKNNEEALNRLGRVIRESKAPPELRAKAMFLLSQILEDQGRLDDAINNYVKISRMYESVPLVAAEGLWRGAQLLEKQSTGAAPIATPTPRPLALRKPVSAAP